MKRKTAVLFFSDFFVVVLFLTVGVENKRARSNVILELLDLYYWALPKKKIYPKWLHVLRPKESTSVTASGQWEGKIRVLKSSITESEARLSESVLATSMEVSKVEAKISDNNMKSEANFVSVENEISSMKIQMKELHQQNKDALKLLQQLVTQSK